MNKTEFVEAIAKETGLTKKDAEAAVNAYNATVTKALKKGDKVAFVGFGTFEVGKRAARTGRNLRQVLQSRSRHLRLLSSRLVRLLRTL